MSDRSLGSGCFLVEKAILSMKLSLDFVAMWIQCDEHKGRRCPAWTVSVVNLLLMLSS